MRALGFAIALIMFGAMLAAEGVRPSQAAEVRGKAVKPGERLAYDIPAQPLAAALDAYSSVTGFEVIYDGALASSRRSTGVKGTYTAEEAMRIMLERTALSARSIAAGAMTIVPATPDPADVAAPVRDNRYYGAMQAAFEKTFCKTDVLRPGSYRGVLSFRIGPSGDIQQPELIGSTGDRDRDQAITDAVRHLVLDGPPPRDLRQPVTMVILPQSSGHTVDCSLLN